MPEVTETIIINRPRLEVFNFATAPGNVPLYSSNLVDFKKTTEGPVDKGTREWGQVKVAGKNIEWTLEITEFEVGERMVARSLESPIDFELEYTYEDAGEGATRVTWHQVIGSFGGFFGKLADPVVTRMYAKDVQSNLAKLKELLEA